MLEDPDEGGRERRVLSQTGGGECVQLGAP
jgi:hypothetical protein